MNEKDKNEMRKFIENWRISRKYADFKKLLEDKCKELLNIVDLPKDKIMDYITNHQLQKNDLEKIADSIIEFSNMSIEDKEELNWIVAELVLAANKEAIYKKLIQSLLAWYTYIFIYQKIEDYEFCSKMMKVCESEKKECLAALKMRVDYDESDELAVEEINLIIKNKILSN